MVKAADLGYISKNLEQVPSAEEKKQKRLERAVSNLAGTEKPESLSPANSTLPKSLLSLGE